jgi:hypothetical protein
MGFKAMHDGEEGSHAQLDGEVTNYNMKFFQNLSTNAEKLALVSS